MKKVTAIYVRRSVSDKDKDNNSLSIESQIAECIKSLSEGEEHRLYCDDGKSAKDIERRPEFMRMMADARQGLLSRIVVKKYDRFSRNMRDYLNVTDELEKYGVSVISLTEPFNTATKEGRLMRNNLLSFAEFERETIAARVTDAYNTRAAETGFYQGGKVYYGYKPERRTVNGKTGSVLVPSDKAHVVQTAYELYKDIDTSLQDLVNYFRNNCIDVNVPRKALSKTKRQARNDEDVEMSNMDRSHFSKLLLSPLYVKADIDVYQYLVSVGYEIIDDVEAFNGVHGLFKHLNEKGREKAARNKRRNKQTEEAEEFNPKDYYIKVGYHEGLIDSETWLAVQDKKSNNKKIPKNTKAVNSWLVGLTKCPHCEFGFYIFYRWNKAKTIQWRYYGDRGVYTSNGCSGNSSNNRKRLKLKPDEVEQVVLQAMRERLDELEVSKTVKEKPDTQTEMLKADVIRIENEIRDLMGKLAKADDVLFGYIQDRVKALHENKSELDEKLRARARRHKDVDTSPLLEPMNRWDSLTIDEKNTLAKLMIEVVYISDVLTDDVENEIDIRFII